MRAAAWSVDGEQNTGPSTKQKPGVARRRGWLDFQVVDRSSRLFVVGRFWDTASEPAALLVDRQIGVRQFETLRDMVV
jgi:hypothetical protein